MFIAMAARARNPELLDKLKSKMSSLGYLPTSEENVNKLKEGTKQKSISEIKHENKDSEKTSHVSLLKKHGYTLDRRLSSGSYSKVYLANHPKNPKGTRNAIKIITNDKSSREKFIKREMEASLKFSHENIVRVLKVFKVSSVNYIIMEHMPRGTIYKYLKINGPADEEVTRKWSRGMASALHYLHSAGWVHRDLKVDNVGLSEDLTAKLMDFGFARQIANPTTNERMMTTTKCGSLPYVAPETFVGAEYDPIKADLWALGVTIYVSMLKRYPFVSGRTISREQRKQQLEEFWKIKRVYSNLSEDAFELLTNLLNPVPLTRYDAKQMLASSWIVEGVVNSMSNKLDEIAI